MRERTQGRLGIGDTITNLRARNEVHVEVIAKMEHYQRTIDGVGFPDRDARTGFRNGYAAEIGYLHFRRQALEALIVSIESYGRVAGGHTGLPRGH